MGFTQRKSGSQYQCFGTRIGKVIPICRDIVNDVTGSYVAYHVYLDSYNFFHLNHT
jgi:hypothetical protein